MNDLIYELVSPYSKEVAALCSGFAAYTIFGQLGITPLGLEYLARLEQQQRDEG